jgi:2-oxoglutarate ferredoxin oxidoreductase subunit alpha
VVGWGSTYGSIKTACAELQAEGKEVSHAHIRHLRPFPRNLGDMLRNFEHVLVPEINNGQLVRILRDLYFVDAIPYNKVMGIPITKTELVERLRKFF